MVEQYPFAWYPRLSHSTEEEKKLGVVWKGTDHSLGKY